MAYLFGVTNTISDHCCVFNLISYKCKLVDIIWLKGAFEPASFLVEECTARSGYPLHFAEPNVRMTEDRAKAFGK